MSDSIVLIKVFIATVIVICFSLGNTFLSHGQVLTHGPVFGGVTDSSAKIWLRTDSQATVFVEYSRAKDLTLPEQSPAYMTSEQDDWTLTIPLTNLEAAERYYVNIVVDGIRQFEQPYPKFRAAPAAGESVDFKVALIQDFSDDPTAQTRAFNSVRKDKPSLVIIGGDFDHSNPRTLEGKRAMFRRLYSIPDLVDSIFWRTPIAHVWDDHDYGKNNADKTYKHKDRSLRVFREYVPTYNLPGPGIWQSFRYGQAEFFLLDTRSQRDPDSDPDGLDKSMLDGDSLGIDGQLEWLEQGLLMSSARWKVVYTSVPFNPTTKPYDSWAAFAAERAHLLSFIRDNSIGGVVFLTGDLHAGGIDDGTNAGVVEMLAPGVNLDHCGNRVRKFDKELLGHWSEGEYWRKSRPCNGYGLLTFLTSPPGLILEIKDKRGRVKVDYEL